MDFEPNSLFLPMYASHSTLCLFDFLRSPKEEVLRPAECVRQDEEVWVAVAIVRGLLLRAPLGIPLVWPPPPLLSHLSIPAYGTGTMPVSSLASAVSHQCQCPSNITCHPVYEGGSVLDDA